MPRCWNCLLGYVLKGVTLVVVSTNDFMDLDGGSFMNGDENEFEGKEEAVYNEAVMEMLKNCGGRLP